MFECLEFEECQYNAQPKCCLPDGVECPHGVKVHKPTNADRVRAMSDEYDLDRLRELAQADREGRCVVLPAPIGGVVYRIEYVFSRPGKYEIGIGEHKMDILFYALEGKHFGKTVFLSHQEAEAALRREQDEKGGGSE